MDDGVGAIDQARQSVTIGQRAADDLGIAATQGAGRRVAHQEAQRLSRSGQRGNDMAADKARSTGDRDCGHSGS